MMEYKINYSEVIYLYPYDWYYYQGNNYYPIAWPDNQRSFSLESPEDYIDWNSMRPDDPPPIITNAPAATSISLVQRKELTGYPNYGNPSGNADILYTGNQGTWTFSLPAFLSVTLNRLRRVNLIIRGVLDDHYNVPENQYRMTVSVNGVPQTIGALPFVHGRPPGQRFNNWRNLNINLSPGIMRRNNSIVIRNTSSAGLNDFIAFDWMELRYSL